MYSIYAVMSKGFMPYLPLALYLTAYHLGKASAKDIDPSDLHSDSAKQGLKHLSTSIIVRTWPRYVGSWLRFSALNAVGGTTFELGLLDRYMVSSLVVASTWNLCICKARSTGLLSPWTVSIQA